MVALNASTLNDLPARVRRPAYDRGRVKTGIAHLSVGNFHRAHQAAYLDACLALPGQKGWGICGVGKGYEAFDKAHIPYAITLGNHDGEAVGYLSGSAAPGNVNQNLRKTFKFNSYFPVSRFVSQRGRWEPGKSDNAYYTFKVGNTNWLVIALEFCPRMGAINWAADIAKEYFNYNTIILTHSYLTGRGQISQRNAGYGDFSPQDIFDKVVKTNPNVRYVFLAIQELQL